MGEDIKDGTEFMKVGLGISICSKGMELAAFGGRSISLIAKGKEEERVSVVIDKVVGLGEEVFAL